MVICKQCSVKVSTSGGLCVFCLERNSMELERCLVSAYYYAKKYFLVRGENFRTNLSEEEFNKQFKNLIK
jgi:hypothetical protein